jgi:prevent-host-death family protein
MAKLQTVTMVELRRHAEQIVEQVRRGKSLVLTYRGRPVVRLEPFRPEGVSNDDPFYQLADMADPEGATLTNREIDELVYGS